MNTSDSEEQTDCSRQLRAAWILLRYAPECLIEAKALMMDAWQNIFRALNQDGGGEEGWKILLGQPGFASKNQKDVLAVIVKSIQEQSLAKDLNDGWTPEFVSLAIEQGEKALLFLALCARRTRGQFGVPEIVAWFNPARIFFLALILSASLLGATKIFRGSWNPTVWANIRYGPFEVVSWEQDYGRLRLGEGTVGTPLQVGGKLFHDGLGTHSNSSIKIQWKEDYKTFSGKCGVTDSAGDHGSVRFKVLAAGTSLFESAVLHGGDAAKEFTVPIEGLHELQLVVDDAQDGPGWDHSAWLELRAE